MSYTITVDVSAIVDLLEIDAADVTVPLADLKAAIEALGDLGGTPVQICDGRLTLTSGAAVTASDVTGATSIYYTPYKGNRIAIYDGSKWLTYTFTEKTLSIAGLAASLPHDVFAYISAGAVTLEAVAWTNGSTRATAITLQDGVYCKSGTLTKRYLGTFMTTSTIGETEDSLQRRLLYNHYNKVYRRMTFSESTSHSYTTVTWRSWNGAVANQMDCVIGVLEDVPFFGSVLGIWGTTARAGTAIGLNQATSPSIGSFTTSDTGQFVHASGAQPFILGYNFMRALEIGNASITFTSITLSALYMN
jgi:hypothetical protein